MTATTPSAITVRQKLQRSQLNPKEVQMELLGKDLDLEALKVYLARKLRLDLVDRVTDVRATRTVEGASSVEVDVADDDRQLMLSGLLTTKFDITIDGLWFRYLSLSKDGTDLTLTFEEREIAVLRTYNKFIIATRSTTTRAEFIRRMITEVKEFRIPMHIPELNVVQPIASTSDTALPYERLLTKDPGIPETTGGITTGNATEAQMKADVGRAHSGLPPRGALTVKSKTADKAQIHNANLILSTGQSLGVRRKLLVCAIMTAITESSILNVPYGDRDSLGVFQQRAGWGSAEQRLDVATSARLFFKAAETKDKQDPSMTYGELCQAVQVSAYPDRYALYRTEAERFVTAYGIPGGDSEGSAADANNSDAAAASIAAGSDSAYMFYRAHIQTSSQKNKGIAAKPENSWECIQRLASEVHWRAFFVSGTFYYMSDDSLFKQSPAAIITERTDGVDGYIDGDYDINKKTAELTLKVRIGAWQCPPGSVIVLQDMGPWNGRWLVAEIERSLFGSSADVTLKKPLPLLPEPLQDELPDQTNTGWASSLARQQASGAARSASTAPAASVASNAGPAASLAKQILQHYNLGHYRDDNGRQVEQLKKIAAGQQLTNGYGAKVWMDPRPLAMILALLDRDYWVGTFAMCEDHSVNTDSGNISQHSNGTAIDTSSLGRAGLGWYALNTYDPVATKMLKECLVIAQSMEVWQLICNGNGRLDPSVQALQIDQGKIRGGVWVDDHINHFHFGAGN